uniref:Kininogen 1 n=1 Tax=Chelonoidis abingdonii TaxID=106734 RepID=A0A8C0H2W0_CHEAB
MKLSTVLFLCCSFFSSRAKPLSTQDADCDDPDVFEAVDIALRKYNREKTDGNQFALYMVMEAKRIVSKLCKIESSCAVGGDKLWHNCDYRASAEAVSGCLLLKNSIYGSSNVTIEGKVNLSHVPCLGCYHPIPGDSLQLLPILRYAIRIFNKQSDQSSLFEVGEVIKASRQVVAGWNYAVEYEVKETSCTKSNFQDLSPECKPIVGGHVGTCEAKAYVDLNNTIVDVAQKCKFPVDETAPPRISICAGCPKPIPTNSTELEEPLRASLEKYNEESNDVFYYKAEAISHATVQVGIPLSFSCSISFRTTSQYFLEMGQGYGDKPLQCTAQVYMIPWTKAIHPKVRCTEEEVRILNKYIISFQTTYNSICEICSGEIFVSLCLPKHPVLRLDEHGRRHDTRREPGHGHGHGHEDEHGRRHDTRREPGHGHGHEDEHGRRHDTRREPGHGHGHEDEHGRRHDTRREPGHGHGHGHEDEHGREHEHEDKHGLGHGHGKHKDKQKKEKDKHKHSKYEAPEESHEKVTDQKETLLAAVAEIPEGTQSPKPDLIELDVLSSTQQSTTDLTDGFIEIPDLPAEKDSLGIIPDFPLFDVLPDLPEPSVPKYFDLMDFLL